MNDEIRMSNDELPESWSRCEIGEISPVVGGGTPPSKDPTNFVMPPEGTPWITPADLSRYREIYISHGSRNLTTKGCANSAAKMLPKGALLFSSRAPVGYVAIASNPVCTNQGFKSFVLPKGFEPRFGYFYLRHIKPIAEAMATGTTFKELSGAAAAKLPFVIAPLAEQKRIADKLEAVLGRVDACRARLDRVPALLKRFRQSVLSAATSGRLTAEWRMTNAVNDDWEETEIQHVAHISTGSTPPKKEASNYGTDFPFVKPGDLDKGEIFETEDGLSKVGFKLSRQLRKGAILVSCIGNLGKIGIAGRPLACNQQINAVEFDQRKVCDRYGYYFAHTLKEWLEENASATTIAIINKGRFSAAPMAIPSLPEQQEIVRRVEDLFAFADRIEARLATAQKTVERLTPATLAKAFRGELVPQDPTDEPASALLARLQGQPPAKPTRATRKPRK